MSKHNKQPQPARQPQKPQQTPVAPPATTPASHPVSTPAVIPPPRIDRRLIGTETRGNDGSGITRKVVSPPEKKEQ